MDSFKKTICNIADEYQHNFEEISNYLIIPNLEEKNFYLQSVLWIR